MTRRCRNDFRRSFGDFYNRKHFSHWIRISLNPCRSFPLTTNSFVTFDFENIFENYFWFSFDLFYWKSCWTIRRCSTNKRNSSTFSSLNSMISSCWRFKRKKSIEIVSSRNNSTNRRFSRRFHLDKSSSRRLKTKRKTNNGEYLRIYSDRTSIRRSNHFVLFVKNLKFDRREILVDRTTINVHREEFDHWFESTSLPLNYSISNIEVLPVNFDLNERISPEKFFSLDSKGNRFSIVDPIDPFQRDKTTFELKHPFECQR